MCSCGPGSDYRWLRDALDRGDLPLVKATAAQLPAVDLATALEITLLIASEEPHNAERAAVRWLGRWALEARDASLAGLLEAVVALSALAQEPERWEAVLRKLVWTSADLRAVGRERRAADGARPLTARAHGRRRAGGLSRLDNPPGGRRVALSVTRRFAQTEGALP